MSIAALFVRFGLANLLLLVVVAVMLGLLGVQNNSGADTAALLGAVMWSCLSFARKNKRYFSSNEKVRVVLGMLVINLVIQAVFSFVAVSRPGAAVALGPLALALLFVGALHAAVIYLFVGFAGRQFAKQVSKGG